MDRRIKYSLIGLIVGLLGYIMRQDIYGIIFAIIFIAISYGISCIKKDSIRITIFSILVTLIVLAILLAWYGLAMAG